LLWYLMFEGKQDRGVELALNDSMRLTETPFCSYCDAVIGGSHFVDEPKPYDMPKVEDALAAGKVCHPDYHPGATGLVCSNTTSVLSRMHKFWSAFNAGVDQFMDGHAVCEPYYGAARAEAERLYEQYADANLSYPTSTSIATPAGVPSPDDAKQGDSDAPPGPFAGTDAMLDAYEWSDEALTKLGVDPSDLLATQDWTAWMRDCNEKTISTPLALLNTSVEDMGLRLHPRPSLSDAELRLVGPAIGARISKCFQFFNLAEQMLAQPALAEHFGANRAGSCSWHAYTTNDHCPTTKPAESALRGGLATALAMHAFWRATPPLPSIREMFRVEDVVDGWGLTFREGAAMCNDTSAAAPDSPRRAFSAGTALDPYDLNSCGSKLLTPGQTLTLATSVTWAGDVSIYQWRPPDEHAFLRFHLKPAKGRDTLAGIMPARTDTIEDAWNASNVPGHPLIRIDYGYARNGSHGTGAPSDFDPRNYLAQYVLDELMMLPGQQMVVEALEDDELTNCTTVVLRQVAL